MRIDARTIGAIFLTAAVGVSAAWLAGAAGGQDAVRSRAYVGHESDADMQGFIAHYPAAAGTRLDDCQTCHRGGVKGTDTEREYSPCSYCHLLVYPNARYATGVPKTPADTLNAYGAAYKNAGRDLKALAALDGQDSDGDGHGNAAEVADLRNPGDPASRPGLPQAATVTLGWDEISRLPVHTQFMLMNTTKEPTDDYVLYKGIRVLDLLSAANVYLTGATGITVFAPDGYSVDYGLEDIRSPFPPAKFYVGPSGPEGGRAAFIKYPPALPDGIRDGRKIPGQLWLLLAYGRSGQPLEPSTYEKGTGRLAGEGPYRLVMPQRRPGRPDRALKAGAFDDGWDFGPDMDHNAGACIRGACVIRINPMPEGAEEYDWKNGWPLVGDRKIVLYGHGIR